MTTPKYLLPASIQAVLLTILDTERNGEPAKTFNKREKVETLIIKDIIGEFTKMMPVVSSMKTEEKVNVLCRYFGHDIETKFRDKLTSISDYLHTNRVSAKTFDELFEDSEKWHEDLANGVERNVTVKLNRTDETEKTVKLIEYTDGYYWINLNTEYSEDEAKNMGHCGKDTGKILFSLRDENSNSHITVSYGVADKSLYQIKGIGNTKPKKQYRQRIVDLILHTNTNYEVCRLLTGGYKSDCDFNLKDLSLQERYDLYAKKPSIEYTDEVYDEYYNNKEYRKCISLLLNGFDYTGIKKTEESEARELLEIINEKDIAGKDVIKNSEKGLISIYMLDINPGSVFVEHITEMLLSNNYDNKLIINNIVMKKTVINDGKYSVAEPYRSIVMGHRTLLEELHNETA